MLPLLIPKRFLKEDSYRAYEKARTYFLSGVKSSHQNQKADVRKRNTELLCIQSARAYEVFAGIAQNQGRVVESLMELRKGLKIRYQRFTQDLRSTSSKDMISTAAKRIDRQSSCTQSPPQTADHPIPSAKSIQSAIDLIATLISTAELYGIRGSPAESTYFLEQAQDVAKSIGSQNIDSILECLKIALKIKLHQFEQSKQLCEDLLTNIAQVCLYSNSRF